MRRFKLFIYRVFKYKKATMFTSIFIVALLMLSINMPISAEYNSGIFSLKLNENSFLYSIFKPSNLLKNSRNKIKSVNELNDLINVSIKTQNYTWDDFSETLNTININEEIKLTIEASVELLEITSIEYVMTDNALSLEDLNSVTEWQTYSDEIIIKEKGNYIIYAKVTDSEEKINYVNSDEIIINGYTQTIWIGKHSASYEPSLVNYITNKSVVGLSYSYLDETEEEIIVPIHNLMSNILLPIGTKLTLVDNITKKVYKYEIPTEEDIYHYEDSCPEPIDSEPVDCIKLAKYPFILFKEMGNSEGLNFIENSYYTAGVTNEKFSLEVDFSNTDFNLNYSEVSLFLNVEEVEGEGIVEKRSTIKQSINLFNIYSSISEENSKATLYLNKVSGGDSIELNENSTNTITIKSGLNYKTIDEQKVIDTQYENKKIGLTIKLVNNSNEIVGDEYLKNIILKVNGTVYYPENNYYNVNLNKGILDTNVNIEVITYKNNADLIEGEYYFKINNYVSIDGIYYKTYGSDTVSIPVVVKKNEFKNQYGFEVLYSDLNKIIENDGKNLNVNYNILYYGEYENPNIRVSLYKKDELSAIDQSYSIVNLASYITDNLDLAEENIYFLSENPIQYFEPYFLYNEFSLNLITQNFDYHGYKFVFDLYEDNKKVSTIEKYFIVR